MTFIACPSDEHHREGHDHGWQTFERKYRIDLRAEAERLAKMSPAIKKENSSKRPESGPSAPEPALGMPRIY